MLFSNYRCSLMAALAGTLLMVGVSGPNHLAAAAPDTYSYSMPASATKDNNGEHHYSVNYEKKELGKPPVVVHHEERRGLARLHRRNFDSLICRLLCLINEERARNHLGIVGLSGTLTKAATDHSGFQAMTNTMSHAGFGGSNFIDRIRSIGGDRFKDPTENVAMGQRSAEAVYNIWRNSPTHYANMMKPTNTHIGIGVAEQGGVLYWTLDTGNIGRPVNSEMCPTVAVYSD